MHYTQINLNEIKGKIKNKIDELSISSYNPKVIAVSKTFTEENILPLIESGHCEFGENKVQEAQKKWPSLKKKYKNLKLHMLGKLQTNKVKHAVEVNLGEEEQKSGISPSDLEEFYKNCKELKLDVIGTMCIPPDNLDPKPFFKYLSQLNKKINLSEISMGMTNDYLDAIEHRSTYLRVGQGIFGKRIK